MAHSNSNHHSDHSEFGYLCVDFFIKSLIDTRALATAFELYLIDNLNENRHSTFDSLRNQLKIEERGLRLLLDLLFANNVIEENNGNIKLTQEFARALQYRDLLLLKIEFANFSAHDFVDLFSLLINRPSEFMEKANLFKLFSYDRCFDSEHENYLLTKRWMRFTTSLTKYESHVCMKYHDFNRYRRMLDIGGNSGEFALQVCKRNQKIHATVFDLPLVCDIGKEHIHSEPEANRISFVKGNALEDSLPEGFDLITFKSILHDWPVEAVRIFINKANSTLKPGGTLLIFERGPLEISKKKRLPYSIIPFFLFSHAFRSTDIYVDQLSELGFLNITVQRIELEMPFFLVSAVKKII